MLPPGGRPSVSVVVVVIHLFSLEILSQAEAVLRLVLGIFVERTGAFEDLLVLLIVVTLGTRFLNGGEAPEDSGDHFVVILEGVIIVPRWSATSGSVVVVVVLLFGLELLSQAKAVLHLVLVVLVERA